MSNSNRNQYVIMDKHMLDRLRSSVCAIGYLRGGHNEYINDTENFVIIGTGFLISETTVITNRHVLEDLKNKQVELGFSDDQKFLQFVYPETKGKWEQVFRRFKFTSIVANKELDVGLIEFVRSSDHGFKQCQPLPLGNPSMVTTGLPIGVFGYPYGSGLLDVKRDNEGNIQKEFQRFGPVLHQGYISAIAPIDQVDIVDKIILDISFAGGMSGSPVFNIQDGSIIGLFYAGMGPIGIVAFAIPIDQRKVEAWIKSHHQLQQKQK